MARLKSTHRGRCQACDSLQKLPGGVLAAHGYTTRWGFFAGTCNGAGHMPFEQSKDYIDRCIADARGHAETLRAKAAAVVVDPADVDPANVMVNAYFAHVVGGGPSGYRWIPSRLGFDAARRVCYWHPGDYSHKEGWRPMTCGSGYTLTTAAATSARKYADHLESEAAKYDAYVTWQTGRIAAWAPAPLTPIDPPTARP
jgi:hypothetical protein